MAAREAHNASDPTREALARGDRPSGRTPAALRPFSFDVGYQRHAEGSCLVRAGATSVVCAATIEERVPHFKRGSGSGWVTAEYAMLPRATNQRTQRDGRRGFLSGRSQEIQRLIGRSLRSVTNLEALGERTVMIDCDVLEADGGTRTASITGAFVALAHAVGRLKERTDMAEPVLIDHVAAVSVGICEGQALLDLDYLEDSRAAVDMNVVMTGGGHFVEVQGTGESRAFSAAELESMLALARQGIGELVEAQRRAIGAHSPR